MGLNAGSSLRRVVTHHKGQNSAILSDEELKLTSGFGSNAVTIWRNDKYPAELVDKDPVGTDPVIYTPGSLVRVVDFPPNSSGHNHRTASLDYGIVFEGELEMVLADGSKTIVRAGDIIVQQASIGKTLHQWNNLTDKSARLIFVLLPSEKTVNGVDVSETGVPEKYLPKIS
ncbi:cupin domain protein [Fusarium tjaetaba]|uniref:Cupin domain protein n=1 Tax=Fusarium tjaetaba TaxID=1567544 RepID=A0A8H5S0N6_9HYPO|nr:cupin domain protein [Fusarium tjaetaba]KAF5642465.1 cupin domain protein [Fusarium tjaetaba]